MNRIIIKKPGVARFMGREFSCSIGRAGVSSCKQEGDKTTPVGLWRLEMALYREDRIKKPVTDIPLLPIRYGMRWCDDINSDFYNQLVYSGDDATGETMFRADHCYDCCVVLSYNRSPVVKGIGSAIFMHVRKYVGYPTLGCVAFDIDDLLWILKYSSTGTYMQVI